MPAATGPIDMAAVRDRKRKMVDGLVEMHLHKYRASGAELVMGSGAFVAPKTIEVALHAGGTRTLRGEIVVISTGSRRGSTTRPASRRRARSPTSRRSNWTASPSTSSSWAAATSASNWRRRCAASAAA